MVEPMFWLLALAFGVAAGITGLMRAYARRANLIDVPNQRSSHDVATPRGGGFSIVAVFLGTVLILATFGKIERNSAISFLVGGGLIAAIGFVDDHAHVSAKWRLSVHFLAAVIAVKLLGGLPMLDFGGTLVDLGVLGNFLLVIFMVWFTNAFNFMDGIDGIAASESICITGGAAILVSAQGGVDSVLLGALTAASLGFLVWNWPPAKIFMGDVGSAFLGFVLVVVMIYTSNRGAISIWSWLILAGVFLVDATTTLVTRIIRRQNWTSAHRSHAYQIASRRFNSHGRVTAGVVLINAVWLFPLAYLAHREAANGFSLTIVAWLPLIGLSTWFGAGRDDRC